jgi:hypothetical protein
MHLSITQFAVGDDEIDYSLWNPDHPLGTSYYGTIIENMPVTEAIPDETQALKYKLITLPKQTTNIPVVNVGNTAITLMPLAIVLLLHQIQAISKVEMQI